MIDRYYFKYRTYDYKPVISKGVHKIRIPLQEIAPSDKCGWKVMTISLSVKVRGDEDRLY